MRKLKKSVVNKRKLSDRRKVKRIDADRRRQDDFEADKYSLPPILDKLLKKVIPEDFDESHSEKLLAEHPIENGMLTLVKENCGESYYGEESACLAY